MTGGIILHHYGTSPFSEKVRAAFGIKDLAWHSVTIPPAMPKPDLLPLTGGYRKTPVMQIGADIFCDTQVILRELERRQPAPTFFPGLARGLAEGTAFWADHQLFGAAVAVAFGLMGEHMPDSFLEDRSKFSGRPLDRSKFKPQAAVMTGPLRAHLGWIEEALGDGRSFLYGDAPSLADLAVYHCVWFVRDRAKSDALADYTALNAWADRMKGFGHGEKIEMTSAAALEIAKTNEPAPAIGGVVANALGLKAGSLVSVTPDDTGRDATIGELVALDAQQVTIRRESAETGSLHVHFPRAGFILVPAKL
ncbi:glutathione S-transferase family protein [Ferrovibrio xuzhouensis]|uniref:Glutathione S-transferase family protein n=1 Tax=Ferrovibrio xuzhouensis TaxID=1576914 RepID=A0ABV7VC63_9PROT